MPTKPKRLCGLNGCQGLWDGQQCTVCDRKPGQERSGWANERRSSRHERGYDSKWVRLRARKLKANPFCEQCLEELAVEATEVHHVRPFRFKRDPLRLAWSNLQSLCRACHTEATATRKGTPGGG